MNRPPVALVTGAARGIGAATVHQLVGQGWQVVAVDVCADDLHVRYPLGTRDQLRSVAEKHAGAVIDLVADVREVAALGNAARTAVRSFGGLDAAVAAAAVASGGRFTWETCPDEWTPMFDVGVHGVANLARAVIPVMLESPAPRTGRFIGVSSAAAHHGMWKMAGYSAAKHAVVGLIKGLAHDLRGTGLTAMAVSPGSTRTAMLAESARIYGLDSVESFATHQLVDRILEPEEVAAVIGWLCSTNTTALTGSVVHADGGFLP
ncbi:mycofactocin-coupled SDR family oxidoreductase [Nocardia sp. NPDC004860]|uniref:mycofactocin-coupled SDR family oxidoreductase n=1 Tax=Nocardia sp. NPDC004860 TaxID=3154557 RepID=UPI00339E7C48